MKKRFSKKTYFRIIIEILFLGIFAFFMYINNHQKWSLFFAAALIPSLFFSRFYCGWICQMHTLFRPVNWIYGKFGIKRFKTPKIFKYRAVRYIMLLIILGAMILTMKFKIKVNIPLYVTIASIAIILFFEESFWHNHFCPYGTILNLSSRPAKFSVKIDEESCTACGLCQKVCPSDAIETLETGKRKIIKNSCLTCFKCQEVCPPNVISYRS